MSERPETDKDIYYDESNPTDPELTPTITSIIIKASTGLLIFVILSVVIYRSYFQQ